MTQKSGTVVCLVIIAAVSLHYLSYSFRGSKKVKWPLIFQEKRTIIYGFSEIKIMLPEKEKVTVSLFMLLIKAVGQKILSYGVQFRN